MAAKQYVPDASAAVTGPPGAPRQARVLCVWLTLLGCVLTQLCALASQVCAECASPHGAARAAIPLGETGSWLTSARRCRFPRLSLLGDKPKLRLSRGLSADEADAGPISARAPEGALRPVEEAVPARDAGTVATLASHVASATVRGAKGNTEVSLRGPALALRRQDDGALAEALRRRSIVARSFMLVGGGAISAGLIAAGLAYTANQAYGQKDPLNQGGAARASADLARIARTGTVATSLLGAGGAALLSGLALKLWSLKARGSDTRIEGSLTAKPHKLGGMLAVRGTWGVAL